MNKLRLMVAAMFAAVASMVVCGQPTLRILPLGDSITVGTGSLETGGYRGPLWAQLTSAGYAYSVKAIFDSFGTRIEKMSRSVDVEMATPGFNIIIR